MTKDVNDGDGSSGGTTRFNRRNVLKMVGASAIGATAMAGTASAWQAQFYGCSQVCSDSRGSRAVVAVGDGYECRAMSEWNSDRQNQEWKWSSACYEVAEGESIVGLVESCDDDPAEFCVNPNNCASNKYDSVDEILDDLNDGSCCSSTIVAGSCDTSGTGGGPPDDPGQSGNGDEDEGPPSNAKGSQGGNGKGKSNGKGNGKSKGKGPGKK